jgi:hypothetical protein
MKMRFGAAMEASNDIVVGVSNEDAGSTQRWKHQTTSWLE